MGKRILNELMKSLNIPIQCPFKKVRKMVKKMVMIVNILWEIA